MPIQLNEESGGSLLVVHVTGKLLKSDYEAFVPEVDRLVRRHGRIRLMFEMQDFHGWDASAAWQDFKFGLAHFSDIERLAIVGETGWQRGMAAFCKPFTRATVKYFDRIDADNARNWLADGLEAVAAGAVEASEADR